MTDVKIDVCDFPKIINAVFTAGIRRGEEIANAYEWGTRAGGKDVDILVCEVCDILNEGKNWENPTRVTEEGVKEFLKV